MGEERRYKIQHESGRILGPFGLDRIELLISKNQLEGNERAKLHPDGEWKELKRFPEIADLLLLHLKGELTGEIAKKAFSSSKTEILQGTEPQQATTPLLKKDKEVHLPETKKIKEGRSGEHPVIEREDFEDATHAVESKESNELNESKPFSSEETEATIHSTEAGSGIMKGLIAIGEKVGFPFLKEETRRIPTAISENKTVVFQTGKLKRKNTKPTWKGWLRIFFIAGGVGYFAYDTFLKDPYSSKKIISFNEISGGVIRPELPRTSEGPGDASASKKLYTEALRYYLQDTVQNYRRAGELLHRAITLDSSNVKAYALLASTYINLIDSSNKDERTFSVISKLIEISKAKEIDLPEAVIAEAEFYILTRRFEAAKSRIVEYTKRHSNFGSEMFYYISNVFFAEGVYADAARYLSQYTEKPFGPKLTFLRGEIIEKLSPEDEALSEYRKSIQEFPNHAKSRLKVAEILHRQGRIKDAEEEIKKLFTKEMQLAPKDLALAFYLRARLYQVNGSWEKSMGDIEKSVILDRSNQIYLMELYSLQAQAGEKNPKLSGMAKMYYFLAEGERLMVAGNEDEAFLKFVQARQAQIDSEAPLSRLGDFFMKKNDLRNALINYKKATEVAPRSLEAWSKYIGVLIRSYEFDEASIAMEKLRPVESAKSIVDRLAGDLYARQKFYNQAQEFYRKAMARESIDPEVYISYAKSLLASNLAKEAPFFFAIALRLDPGNFEAIRGTSQAIAKSDSIDRGIEHLKSELTRVQNGKSVLLSALADLLVQKGDLNSAMGAIQQAKDADPSRPEPWISEAKMILARDSADPKAIDKAITLYKSALDRNSNDVDSRIELFHLLLSRSAFERANEELNRIFEVYPKYPALHSLKGFLYARMGNHKAAIDEYQKELKYRPYHHDSLVGIAKEYIEDKKPDLALKQLTLAMKASPDSGEARHLAGYCNYLLGNYEAAVALYQSAAKLDAGNPLLFKRIGAAYQAMGDAQKASEAFRKYLDLAPDAPDRTEIERFL